MTKATRTEGKKDQASRRKAIRILWIVCPIVLAGLAVCLILTYGTSPTTPPPSDGSLGPADRVDIVYFHPTHRCYSCRWLETGTNYTVNTYFADELASGKLTFQVINMDGEANSGIVKKYKAFTSSLFINTVRDGADDIEQAIEVYYLIGKEEAFVTALTSKIEKCLNGET